MLCPVAFTATTYIANLVIISFSMIFPLKYSSYNDIMNYNKGVIFVAVPEEIRKVPRPKNTVVCDNGNGLKRYVVRQRAGS